MASPVLAASSTGPELLLLNSMTGSILRQAPTPSLISHLEFSHSAILSGASDGFIRTHDPRTALNRPESQIMAHYSGIQGLQTTGNFVFTIGLGVTRRCLPLHWLSMYNLTIGQTSASLSRPAR
jgi:PAB-dependent poly(A)-specific ribonuclease subunit 2